MKEEYIMKTFCKLFGFVLITISLVLAGCRSGNDINTDIYGISLSSGGSVLVSHVFTGLTPLTVTVENTGNKATGVLTVTAGGANPAAFDLSDQTLASITAGGSVTFTVIPEAVLSPGSYSATITVSGGNNITASFSVSYIVVPENEYEIGLIYNSTALTGHTFTDLNEITVTVVNMGSEATGELDITLTGDDADSFELSDTTLTSIVFGGTATFTVKPADSLEPGEYNATVTVSGGNAITASFTVDYEEPMPSINSISLEYEDEPIEDYTFTTRNAITVTIKNTGTLATGTLTINLTGNEVDNFTLNTAGATHTTSLNRGSLAPQATATFPVNVTAGRLNDIGLLSATIMVSNGSTIDESFTVNFNSRYGLSLATEGFDGDLTGQTFEFENDDLITVTATNTGTNQTGAWQVVFGGDNPAAFRTTTTNFPNFTAGNTGTFTVGPVTTGLVPGILYTALVTVRSIANVGPENLPNASFTVSYYIEPTSQYDIGLTYNNETLVGHTFTDRNPITVTVVNTGTGNTGELTVGLSGTNAASFELSGTPITGIAVGSSATFTVKPLNSGNLHEHSAIVTVSGGNDINASFEVSYHEPQNEEIALKLENTIITNYTFNARNAITVTIENTGTQNTGDLTITMTGNDVANFTLNTAGATHTTSLNRASIAPQGTATFPVNVSAGRLDGIGLLSVTVTVSNGNAINESFTVYFDSRYSLSLTTSGFDGDLTGKTYEFEDDDPIIVTATNTGTNQTGAWQVVFGGDNPSMFRTTTTNFPNFTAGNTGTFNVEPVTTGMTDGTTYTALVTVRSTAVVGPPNLPQASFTVSYTYTAPAFSIELRDNAGSIMPEVYYLLDDGAQGKQFTVKVHNTSSTAATGNLSVALSGTDAASFTLGGLTGTEIPSIAVGSDVSITVTANDGLASKIYNATLTVSNTANGINESFNIIYWAFSKADFGGTFVSTNRRIIIDASANKFTFDSTQANNVVRNVVSNITSWKKVVWVIESNNSGDTTFAANNVITAWEIECTVESVESYPNSVQQINLYFGLPAAAAVADLNTGHTFKTWVFCRDPATISGTGNTGINAGLINVNNLRAVPWANFIKQ